MQLGIIFLMALQPLWALAVFQSPVLFTIGRTPWTSDQLVARPLPKHRTSRTQIKHIYTPNIHTLSVIRTHDHSVRASEDSSCLRPLGYRPCVRPSLIQNRLVRLAKQEMDFRVKGKGKVAPLLN
jgi:hypothetical protein